MPTTKKISQLTALTNAAGVDLLPIVDDPGGTPETKKITLNSFFGNVASNTVITGTFRVKNTAIIDSNVTLQSDLSVNGSISVTGNGNFSNPVTFDNTATFNSDTTVFGSFDVDGSSQVTGNISFTNASSRIVFGDGTFQNTAFKLSGPYANDSAANTGGVTVNSLYFTANGEVRIRLS